jgi:hypothetical protein
MAITSKPLRLEDQDYIKEQLTNNGIYRQVRKINKALGAMEKLDKIQLEHPAKSLEDLVADKNINNDQLAQALS